MKRNLVLGAVGLLASCISCNEAAVPATLSNIDSHREGARMACQAQAGSLPDPSRPAGTNHPSIPVEHIFVIMQENHSFDQYFGQLSKPQFYGDEVDGLKPGITYPDRSGQPIAPYHEETLCVQDVDHTWNAMHAEWNNGKNDRFVAVNGERAIGYYDENDLPFYYALANEFAIADRFFCSALTQTFPNRFFLLTGTAFGHIKNDYPKNDDDFTQKTIFDVLDEYGISWKYYNDYAGYLGLFQTLYRRDNHKMGTVADFDADLRSGILPQVVFVDSRFDGEDEHPAADIQIGQEWVAKRTRALMNSKVWPSSALFFTYDENGGFADHVPPPAACLPDDIPPMLVWNSYRATYDRLGFRVPFVLVSPWAKRHYVSHTTYDLTSILKFIETKFNLPALTRRDANADAMLDLFDFENPRFDIPALPSGAPAAGRACKPPPRPTGGR